jgi:hypothetical protein
VRRSNSDGSEIFRTCTDRPRGPPSLLYNGYRASFPGIYRSGSDINHLHPASAEVKERIELYLCSTFWVFMACPRVKFTFTFRSMCKFSFFCAVLLKIFGDVWVLTRALNKNYLKRSTSRVSLFTFQCRRASTMIITGAV